MQSNRLMLVVAFFEVVVASVLLFAGSAFLFAASYGATFHYGTVQLIPVLMLVGMGLSGPGILLAWDAARKLKVIHLMVIAVADLLGAVVFILLVISPLPEMVSGWLAIAGLNSFLLGVALVAGHKVKKSAKVYSSRRKRQLEDVLEGLD